MIWMIWVSHRAHWLIPSKNCMGWPGALVMKTMVFTAARRNRGSETVWNIALVSRCSNWNCGSWILDLVIRVSSIFGQSHPFVWVSPLSHPKKVSNHACCQSFWILTHTQVFDPNRKTTEKHGNFDVNHVYDYPIFGRRRGQVLLQEFGKGPPPVRPVMRFLERLGKLVLECDKNLSSGNLTVCYWV